MAAVVVFWTVYALILPAITLESEILCCSYTVHQHNESCYDEKGNIICGYADYAVHTHQESYCYDDQGNLICEWEEIAEHVHTADCYEEQLVLICGLEENGEHAHTDECYETRSVLICEKPEVILHTHTGDCYDEGGNLICGQLQVEAHQHDKGCLARLTGGISLLGADDSASDLAGTLIGAKILINGVEYDGSELDKSSRFAISLTSSVDDNALKYFYRFPEQIVVENADKEALMADKEQIGTYWIQDGVLYVEYNQSYTNVTSNFELSATWNNDVGNSTTVKWSDTLNTEVTFRNDDLQIQKTDSSNYKLVSNDDGSLYIEYTVRTAVSGGGTLNLTDSFRDSVSREEFPHITELLRDVYGTEKDYQLTIYSLRDGGDPNDISDYTPGSPTYGQFDSVSDNETNGQMLSVNGIKLAADQYAELKYQIMVSPENRAKLDASGAYLLLTNTATAVTVPAEGEKPLTASVTHNATYSPGAEWIQKTANSDSSGDKDNSWSITVNYGRTSDMDGFALLDDLQSGAKGYKIDEGSFTLQIQGDDGKQTIALKVIDVQEKIEGILNNTEYTREQVIAFLTSLYSGVAYANSVEEINAFLADGFISLTLNMYFGVEGTGENGAVTLSDLSKYVFVDNGTDAYAAGISAPLFFWFSPESSVVKETFGKATGDGPYSYTIQYQTDQTDVSSPVGVVNSAQAVWRGVVAGTEPVFSNPQVQLVKGNSGVYEGADGGMYVDWTIEVTVPGNSSALNDVWLVDTLPSAKVTVAGQQYDTMPTLQGLKSDTLDASRIEYVNGVMTEETRAYLTGLVGSEAIKIRVDGEEGGVSRTVAAMLGAPEISAGNCFMVYQGAAAKLGTMYLENLDGYSSVSPRVFSIHLGTLPSTENSDEGYTITLTYTTKVNPNTMPLATQSYVEAINKVALYSKLDGTHDTKLAESQSEYWLAKQEAEDSVVKNVVSYDAESRILTYRVQIDPLNNLEAGYLIYQLQDILSDYPGATYIEDSFKLYLHAKIISGKYEESNQYWKYDSAIEHLIWMSDESKVGTEIYGQTIPNEDGRLAEDGYDTKELYKYLTTEQVLTNEQVKVLPLELTIDNDTGQFVLFMRNIGWMSTTIYEGTKVVPMTLEYQVQLPEGSGLHTVINNQVTLSAQELMNPGPTALIGVARASYDTQDILNKAMIQNPNSTNGYTAQFRIIVSKTTLEDKIKLTDEDAVLNEIVIHDELENLNLDTFSAVLEGVEENGDWVAVPAENWSLSIDPDNSSSLTVTIRDVDDKEKMPYTRYRLTYFADVVGNVEETVHYSNTASMDVDGVADARVEEEVYIQQKTGSSTVINIHIVLVKVDGNNATEAMEGVKFALYSYDAENQTWVKRNAELSTNKDSKIELVNGLEGVSLHYNTWYCLEETETLKGYRLAEPLYFYILNPNETTAMVAPSAGINKEAWQGGSALEIGDREVIYNFRPYFRVEKYDATADVRIWEGVEFTLYDSEGNVVQTKKSSDGIFTFSELTMGTTYYLKETGVPEGYTDPGITYTVMIDGDGGVTFTPQGGIAQAPMEGHTYSFRIDNIKKNPFVLPETGGTGTILFTIGGLFLITAAVGCGYGLRRRKERRTKP